jgi:hypothetical protein
MDTFRSKAETFEEIKLEGEQMRLTVDDLFKAVS